MKICRKIKVVVCGSSFVLAIGVVTSLGIPLQAGEIPTKGAGAAKLIQRNRPNVATVAEKDSSIPMSCPKCKSEWTARMDHAAKGAVKPTVLVENHLCAGCDTRITAVGEGKARRDVVTHKCTACGSDDASCCATTKGAGPTRGMEKN